MRKAVAVAAIVVLLFLFFIANRGAYEGYFSGDDLDNIGWTHQVSFSDFLVALVSPRYYPHHFRPVGHMMYGLLGRAVGIEYRWYVRLIHALHLLTAGLVAVLLLRIGLSWFAAGAGALFFLFHMGVFEVLWKPMFLFDLLCGLFCLLSLLSYTSRRYVLSFLLFWLAYKSKEHAVMLPVVFALYECWIGERNWKRLAPFFAVSALFGLQAVMTSRDASNYQLDAHPLTLARTFIFYAGKLTVEAWLAVFLIPLALRVKDRRMWLALSGALLMILPVLALPSRMYGAYLYASMPLAALAVGTAAQRLDKRMVAAFFLAWLPLNFQVMREHRKTEIARAHENRAYVDRLRSLPVELPEVRRFVYDGHPPELQEWGIRGILRYLYKDAEIEVYPVESRSLSQTLEAGGVALLSWENPVRKLDVLARRGDAADVAYLEMTRTIPVWQLGEGWYAVENGFRWSKPRAEARLYRPAGARQFELYVNAGPQYMKDVRRARVTIRLDGVEAGVVEFEREGWQRARIDLAAAAAGTVQVELQVEPEYRPSKIDPRVLGIPVGGLGFVDKEKR